MSKSKLLFCGIFLVVFLISTAVAQETETLLGKDTKLGFALGFDLKVNSIQDKTGTLFEFYAGALINPATIIAFAGGMNIGHPEVNYGYLGLLGQYTFKPQKMIHFSAQLLLGIGSTKDYERPKSSVFDNYGNISGPGFYLIEPAVNVELNLSVKARLFLGLGYRMVSGLDEDHELIQTTGVTNKDLSGLNVLFGVKFARYE
ncbi:hypothetical protein ACFL6A_04695 [bacterium]